MDKKGNIPDTMTAMVFETVGEPLQKKEVPVPRPEAGQVLIRVNACGVCRTDLHIVDGELSEPKLPLIPGHEIVGNVVGIGNKVTSFKIGDKVGIPWLGYTCGQCKYCKKEKENLCDNALFTGYTINGGYAQYTVADQGYCFAMPEKIGFAEAAPLLCAGLIGYRSYRMAGGHDRLGIYGFGAAAHILAQVASFHNKEIYAFTRSGDSEGQNFALKLGAKWAGDSDSFPPEKLDAAIIFAPVGALIPASLRATDKGGTVVCAGIHMSDIPSFPYHILWKERTIKSVANLTRNDGEGFFELVSNIPVKTTIQKYKLTEANEALSDLRSGKVTGAAVLVMGELS